jgi:chemotaxis family two-component system response regulator Rcp1
MIRILLVEDNLGDIRLTQEAFKELKTPIDLHYVTDGEEAIKFLLREAPYENAPVPQLILLDINLPKKDGRQVLKFIKNEPILKRIPVIILSTSNSDADILQIYDLNANCYLTKPIDYECFLEMAYSIELFWIQKAKLPNVL